MEIDEAVRKILDLTTTLTPHVRYRYPIHHHYYTPGHLEQQVKQIISEVVVSEKSAG